MKRIGFIFIIVFLFFVILLISVKPIILSLAKWQIKKAFIDSEVIHIGRGGLNLPYQCLILSDIDIKKEPIYDFKIKELRIYYSLKSLFRKTIPKAYIDGASIHIKIPQKSILDFRQYLSFKSETKGSFLIQNLEFSNLYIGLDTKDFSIDSNVSSLVLCPRESLVKSFNLTINSLVRKDFRLGKTYINFDQDKSSGDFYIKEIIYNKVKIQDIKSKMYLKDNILSLGYLSAELFGGSLEGNLNLSIDKNLEYNLNLKAVNISLDTVARDLNMLEKFQMSGRLGGDVSLRGKGFDINFLKGDFSTTEPGGSLTIKDKRFLKTLARNTKQSLDILVKGFEDYHYTTGSIRLSLKENDLILDIALEGETGKRNLIITVHNCFKK